VRFGATRLRTSLLQYSDEKNRFRVIAINVPMSEFKANLGAPSISVDGGALDETFAVSDMPRLLGELDRCLVDLQDYWNVGPQRADRIASPAKSSPPLNALYSRGDYPSVALSSHLEGSVTMTFLVDETGGIADCSVDDTSGIPALDTMSCYVVKNRARFEPARGADGKPIRSAYTQKVVWRIAP
jgi:TonB family protein